MPVGTTAADTSAAGTIRHDPTRSDTTRHDTTRSDPASSDTTRIETASSDTDGLRVRPAVARPWPTSAETRAAPLGSAVVLPGAAGSTTRDGRTNEQRGRYRPATPPLGPVLAGLTPAAHDLLARPAQPTDSSHPPVGAASTAVPATLFDTVAPPAAAAASPTAAGPIAQRSPADTALPARSAVLPGQAPFTGAGPSDRPRSSPAGSPLPSAPPVPTATARPVPTATGTTTATQAGDSADRSRRHTGQLMERPTPDRFLDVLHATPAPMLQRLPERFAPLARAVTGGTDVTVRHDTAARAALAAVGKRAATIGNTIVLPERPGAGTDIGVLAHELTHVAHPSPRPRFFADDHDSAEERQADAVAQLIRRSPALRAPASSPSPASSTATTGSAAPGFRSTAAPDQPVLALPPPPPRLSAPAAGAPTWVGRGPAGDRSSISRRFTPAASTTVRRSMHTDASPSGRPAGTAPPRPPAVVQRSTSSSTSRVAAAASAAPIAVRRAVTPDATTTTTSTDDHQRPAFDIVGNLDHTGGVVDFVDWVVEQVEDRVVAEIQRRGGRFREDF